MYLDFFSIDAQRYALAVAANCCVNVSPDEFHYCRDSLPLLSSKLLTAVSIVTNCLLYGRVCIIASGYSIQPPLYTLLNGKINTVVIGEVGCYFALL